MPHIVTVTGNRISLRRGQSYILGRGLDCDVVVEDSACSRRHCRLTVSKNSDTAFLEDLGSRNGTFLNGERVHSRTAVREGSRLQMGASIFLARLKEERAEIDLSDTGTVAFEQSSTHDLDGGELAEYGVVDLVRLLFNSQRSVTVHVSTPAGHAILEVRSGDVWFADFAGLEGFNALVKLGRQEAGIFWLSENTADCVRNIQEPSVRLLTELSRCVDPAAAPRVP